MTMPDVFVADEKKPKDKLPLPPDPVAPGTVLIKKKEHHPFTAFHRFPEGISFQNQEKGEKIYLFIRRHFTTNTKWVSATFALALLPFVLLLVQQFLLLNLFEIPGNFLLILLLFYYLIVFGFAFVSYVTWFYNVGIITNLRVIDVDITSLQNKNVAATVLEDIIDVEYSQRGFLGNTFDYGDVHLQTEGMKPNFEYLLVPHPAQIADTLTDLKAGRKE